ncbi:hypothetical protein HELRODRAFT_79600, partial [Helobdella robusta]|uniref:G-protein coupled receptors family 1 profile domain-containing protein n=1 Tax=Helobdella robusta TaxID=6412 RepID=T1G3Q6_HELRO
MSDNNSTSSLTTLSYNETFSFNPYIMPWYIEVLYGFFFLLMVLVAAGGNFIVIWIVVGHKRMRTVTNYFLVNLAISDALITIFNTMFNFIYMARSHWPFGSYYCKFTHFIVPCTISSSVFTFIAIAFDRYMVIVYPLKPRLSARKVLAVIFAIWVISISIAVPNIVFARIYVHTNENRTVCYLNFPNETELKNVEFSYNLFFFLFTYIVPCIVLLFTYVRIAIELGGSKMIGEVNARHQETIKSKKKIVKMLAVVVTIFAVCWLPQNVVLLIHLEPEVTMMPWFHHFYLIIYWIAMSNSMYNPIIYCWMNAKFRSGFKYVLRWMPCVKWQP